MPRLPQSTRVRRNSGVSLVEVITALGVLTFGVMGALQMYNVHHENLRALQESAVAHAALTSELESLVAAPPAMPTRAVQQPFNTASPARASLHLVETWTELAPFEGHTDLIEASAHIVWIGQYGRRIERSLVTLVRAGHQP